MENQNTQNQTPQAPVSTSISPVQPEATPPVVEQPVTPVTEAQPVAESTTSSSAAAPLSVSADGKGGNRLKILLVLFLVLILALIGVYFGRDYLIPKPATSPVPEVKSRITPVPTEAPSPTPEAINNQTDLNKALGEIDKTDPASVGAGMQQNQTDAASLQ